MNKLEMPQVRIARGRAARIVMHRNYEPQPSTIKPHQGKREIARRLKRATKGE